MVHRLVLPAGAKKHHYATAAAHGLGVPAPDCDEPCARRDEARGQLRFRSIGEEPIDPRRSLGRVILAADLLGAPAIALPVLALAISFGAHAPVFRGRALRRLHPHHLRPRSEYRAQRCRRPGRVQRTHRPDDVRGAIGLQLRARPGLALPRESRAGKDACALRCTAQRDPHGSGRSRGRVVCTASACCWCSSADSWSAGRDCSAWRCSWDGPRASPAVRVAGARRCSRSPLARCAAVAPIRPRETPRRLDAASGGSAWRARRAGAAERRCRGPRGWAGGLKPARAVSAPNTCRPDTPGGRPRRRRRACRRIRLRAVRARAAPRRPLRTVPRRSWSD